MKNLILCVLTALIVSCAGMLARAEFRLEKVDSETFYDGMFAGLSGSPCPRGFLVSKEPEIAGKKKYGEMRYRPARSNENLMIAFLVVEPKGTTTRTLFIDWNANKDLTDDDPILLSGGESKPGEEVIQTVTTKIPGLGERHLRIFFRDDWSQTATRMVGANSLVITAFDWWHGKVKIEGKSWDVALYDSNLNGLELNSRDMMFIDRNADNHFDIFGQSGPKESIALRRAILVDDNLYSVTLDKSKTGVSINPYAGTTGRLTLVTRLPTTFANPAGQMLLSSEDGLGFDFATTPSLAKPIVFPAVSYSYAILWLIETDGENLGGTITACALKPVTIPENDTLMLVLDEPATLGLKVQQEGNTLTINKICPSRSGAFDYLVASPNRSLSEIKRTAPAISIFEMKNDKKAEKLAGGRMEYG